MNRPKTRNSMPRWRALGNTTLAIAAVAVIGLMSIAPARADNDDWRYRRDWREREWREHREYRPTFGLYFSSPSPYGYYQPYYQYNYDDDRSR